ncbi:MAG: methyltransferase domain-containing protein [Candidatus Aminicenantes bacterium]|nr:methyltransferase domain-containing protein [Candidatus Aminicenantes bacterium]
MMRLCLKLMTIMNRCIISGFWGTRKKNSEASRSVRPGSWTMSDPQDFPWTFDQFHRYEVLKKALKFFFRNQTPHVLDVGGISPGRGGKAFWFPIRKLVPKNSFVLDKDCVKGAGFIQGDAAHLPLKDQCFDVTAALDVIEHIPSENRADVLKELGRVSQDLVVLSVPKASPQVREAEDMISEQVQKLYGVSHVQLEEHRRFGLPKKEFISEAFKDLGFSQVCFSYGSLRNWMFFQSLKHGFLFQAESKSVAEGIDWFAAQYLKGTELSPLFVRDFWVASRNRRESELKKGVHRIQDQLKGQGAKSPKQVPGQLDRLKAFNRGLIRSFSKDKVTGVILAETGGQNLRDCLKHALSQKVDFDFEVCVLNIGENPDIRYMMKAFFPEVKYLSLKQKSPITFREQMLELFCQLKGDYILLVDEERMLPQDEAAGFLRQITQKTSTMVLVPDEKCVFVPRTVFSDAHWDEKLMQRKIKAMGKQDILKALREGLESDKGKVICGD